MKLPDIPEDEAPDEPALVDPAAKWALATTTAVAFAFLIGAELVLWTAGQGMKGLLTRVVHYPGGTAAVAYLLPLSAFFTPVLPLVARWGREGFAFRAALVALLGALALCALVLGNLTESFWFGIAPLVLAGMVSVGGGTAFMFTIVGLENRRAVAGGVVGALLLAQTLTLRGHFQGVGAVAAATAILVAGLGLTLLWRRAPSRDRSSSLERRAGGFRLRGALAFGALLFLQLVFDLGGWADFSSPSHAAWLRFGFMIPPALAWLFVVRGVDLPRHRLVAVGGAAVVALGILIGAVNWKWVGYGALVAHTASLMLVGRALSPASGRRSAKHLVFGLVLFVVLSLCLYVAMPEAGDQSRRGRALLMGDGLLWGNVWWIEIWPMVAAIVLIVTMYLTPKPPRTPAPIPDAVAFAIAALIPILSFFATF